MLVFQSLRPLIMNFQDSLQFEYQTHTDVEDAVLYLLHRAYSYLPKSSKFLRILFVVLGAFSTIQGSRVTNTMIDWITVYLIIVSFVSETAYSMLC